MPPEEDDEGHKHLQTSVRWADIETGEPPQRHGEWHCLHWKHKVSCFYGLEKTIQSIKSIFLTK